MPLARQSGAGAPTIALIPSVGHELWHPPAMVLQVRCAHLELAGLTPQPCNSPHASLTAATAPKSTKSLNDSVWPTKTLFTTCCTFAPSSHQDLAPVCRAQCMQHPVHEHSCGVT